MTNRELDKWIHVEIFKRIVPTDHDINDVHCDCVPRYTESRGDSIMVVEEMTKDGTQVEMGNNYIGDDWYCVFGRGTEFLGHAKTLPFAICKAAKRAFEGK